MEDKKISIITPVFNSENFLEECIVSVLNQTYKNWELILVDDNSTDDSIKIIQDYLKKDKRIRFVKNDNNLGVAKTRNRGIRESTGDYIAFLDSDDIWLSNKLEEQFNFIKKNNYTFIFSAYFRVNEKSEIIKEISVPDVIEYPDLLKMNVIACSTVLFDGEKIRNKQFKSIGHEDYEMWLRIIQEEKFFYGIKNPLVKYRVRKKSLSSNKFKTLIYQWNIYRREGELGFFSSCYYLCFYILKNIFKRL